MKPEVDRPQLPQTPEPATRRVAEPQAVTHTPLKITKRRSPWKIVGAVIAILLVLAIIAAVSGVLWYRHELSPPSTATKSEKTRVVIKQGMTPGEIGTTLYKDHLIRSELAFGLYIRLHGVRDELQAGTYLLAPSESTSDIVAALTSGKVEYFTVTFLPGATLAEDRTVLLKSGYSAKDVDAALNELYSESQFPIFATKPAKADLEGYIYGDTYTFSVGSTSVQDILGQAFTEFSDKVKANDLVAAFKKQHLTLYQGIILASIIQREVSSSDANVASSDQKQVAQVFYKRLRAGEVLGSDVTFQYAAKRFNLPDDPSQDSPYNTRKVKGLPPGPIATPSLGALEAAAHPAGGDYEYFLAGDDGKVYFSHTEAEHEANIATHCKINCSE